MAPGAFLWFPEMNAPARGNGPVAVESALPGLEVTDGDSSRQFVCSSLAYLRLGTHPMKEVL